MVTSLLLGRFWFAIVCGSPNFNWGVRRQSTCALRLAKVDCSRISDCFILDGRPTYCYNLFGIQRFYVRADEQVPAGDHQLRLEFSYDGGGLGKGGTADLYLDGTRLAGGHIDGTVPLVFSGDETLDVGSDTGTPVSDDYEGRASEFTGRVHRVQIDLGDDANDADHLITPEERMRIITSRQ